tara:strand:+ start:168 stop:371 length:204 start_codon:yes stop_codon:yes gene_type:complete
MKITKKIIKDLEKALDMRGKDGNPIWDDGDEVEVCVAGVFKADKFITVLNRTKNPFKGSIARGNSND